MKLSPHCVTILQLILIFIYYKVYSITTLHKIYQKKKAKIPTLYKPLSQKLLK